MNRLQKIGYIISWILPIAVKLVLWFFGLFIVTYCVRKSDQSANWPRWAWLWGNDEEGYPIQSEYSAWWWYAMRNTTNNTRYLFDDRVPQIETNWLVEHEFDFAEPIPMEAGMMLEHGQAMAYRWAWSGPFAGYRRVWLKGSDKYSEFWIGWKVGSVVPGMGFTLQLRFNREIGR